MSVIGQCLQSLQQLEHLAQQINEEPLSDAARKLYHCVSLMYDWLTARSREPSHAARPSQGKFEKVALTDTMQDVGFEKSACKWTGSATLPVLASWGIDRDTLQIFIGTHSVHARVRRRASCGRSVRGPH